MADALIAAPRLPGVRLRRRLPRPGRRPARPGVQHEQGVLVRAGPGAARDGARPARRGGRTSRTAPGPRGTSSPWPGPSTRARTRIQRDIVAERLLGLPKGRR
ncbi:hypothetical protein LT493_01400 [Streptomyces tricolor]|nr:hypothetical protein [Streptomyces tricolor]